MTEESNQTTARTVELGEMTMNKNNLTWLYEGDAWFQSIAMFATATKMRGGDIIPEFGSIEELNEWLLAEHEEDSDAY